jgi:predicted NodU family carbamoyl transferase
VRIVGISEGMHDAAMCVLIDNKIYHASHIMKNLSGKI